MLPHVTHFNRDEAKKKRNEKICKMADSKKTTNSQYVLPKFQALVLG